MDEEVLYSLELQDGLHRAKDFILCYQHVILFYRSAISNNTEYYERKNWHEKLYERNE